MKKILLAALVILSLSGTHVVNHIANTEPIQLADPGTKPGGGTI